MLLLLLPAALISRNVGLLESRHQTFRAGCSHRLPPSPKSPRPGAHSPTAEETRSRSSAPAQSHLSSRVSVIAFPRQKTETSTQFSWSTSKTFLWVLFMAPLGYPLRRSPPQLLPCWGPPRETAQLCHPLRPRSRAALHRAEDKTPTALQRVKRNFCCLLLYRLPPPTSGKSSLHSVLMSKTFHQCQGLTA